MHPPCPCRVPRSTTAACSPRSSTFWSWPPAPYLIGFVAGVYEGGEYVQPSSTLTAVMAAWALYYYFACESGGGQTLGKKVMRIRVVRTDGGDASMGQIAVRTVLRLIDGLFLYLVGLIVMLATGKRRGRLGDLAGDTMVVSADGPAPALLWSRSRTRRRGARRDIHASERRRRAAGGSAPWPRPRLGCPRPRPRAPRCPSCARSSPSPSPRRGPHFARAAGAGPRRGRGLRAEAARRGRARLPGRARGARRGGRAGGGGRAGAGRGGRAGAGR